MAAPGTQQLLRGNGSKMQAAGEGQRHSRGKRRSAFATVGSKGRAPCRSWLRGDTALEVEEDSGGVVGGRDRIQVLESQSGSGLTLTGPLAS